MADQTSTTSTSTSASDSAKESTVKKSASKPSAKKTSSKKTAAKKSVAKKSVAKKSVAKKTSAKKTTSATSSAKRSTARKVAPKKTSAKSATKRSAGTSLVRTMRDTTASTAETGRAVVAKAAGATRKPVEAGRALVGRAGERVAGLGRAALAPTSQFFASAQKRAAGIVADPVALKDLADQALHSESGRSGPLGEVVDDFRTLGRLVAAYGRGDYRDIPLDSLVMVTAGLLYVVSPIDLIPDAIPVAGFADDAVAVGFVIRQVHHELTAFREWEAKAGPSS
jgi:uncharacterized membrane protein YkvA (DUF1232 family)